jgi:DNA-binding CsgD family transcriptional regulator
MDSVSELLLDKLRAEVNVMSRLLAISLTQGKTQREKILMLSVAGMNRNEIAELVGTTPGTVSVELSNFKSKKKKGKE